MNAIGMYIFCGSQTIGHLLEGWSIDTILEMTEEMVDQNAYHFIKNYPDIQVKKPSEFMNNDKYLEELKSKNYDLLYSNPPCSGLSLINRNANVNNKVNGHIYEVFDMVDKIKPKTFLIENAPTLTTTGLPILQSMTKRLPDYRFVIINDLAGNHNVAMCRRRTLVVGFNKKYFNKIPVIHSNSQPFCSIRDVLETVDYTYNKEFTLETDQSMFKYYKYIKPESSFLLAMAENNVQGLPENKAKEVEKIKYKLEHNERIWDKSPWRPAIDNRVPSLASVVKIAHPTENRDLYIREYAALMGYPNDFIFYPECKTPQIQCISQGVPVNFIRYISSEIKNSFTTKEFVDGSVMYINQANPKNIRSKVYNTVEEFLDASTIYG